MTSGSFHAVEVASISSNRSERQRRDLEDIHILADSIRRLGLIHPLVVTRDRAIVAGERRLEAVRSLGWTTVACQYIDEIDPDHLRAIELEENIKRSDLAWHDKCRAIYDYHISRGGTVDDKKTSWTIEATGEALGLTAANISQHITVYKEILDGNQRVIEAPKFSTARGITERVRERRAESALESLRSAASLPKDAPEAGEPDSIINADFTEWVKAYEGPRFNFLHCDFPYGINAQNFNQSSAPAHGDYDDSEDVYWNLLSHLLTNIDRICTESCHIIFWFSLHHYQRTLNFFAANSDFVLDPFPLIWLKSDGVGILPDPSRGPRRVYETALFGSRGDRKILSATSNGYAAPSVRDKHMSEKSEAVLRHFFRMFIDENTIMLDPTCGSGSSLRAAESLGAKHAIGIERNEEYVESARRALKAARALREKP